MFTRIQFQLLRSQIDLFELELMLEHLRNVQRHHIGLLLMVGFHRVIVVVIVLVKEFMIKNYIGLLMEVFLHRSNKEEVVQERNSCYRKIPQQGYLFVFQIICCLHEWVFLQNHLQKLRLQLWPFLSQMSLEGCKFYVQGYLSIDVALHLPN